jgi:hypothetical protein
MTIEGAGATATGAEVVADALASAEALPADSLESAVQEKNASIAIRLTGTAAINNTLTPRLVNFF